MADEIIRKERRKGQPGPHMSEKSPNPHGEAKILEMPILTHQRRETGGRNVGQTTNTVGGVLNPSVAHDLQPGENATSEQPLQDNAAGTQPTVREEKKGA